MHFQLCYASIHAKMSDAVMSCSVPSINQARIYEDEAGFGLVARQSPQVGFISLNLHVTKLVPCTQADQHRAVSKAGKVTVQYAVCRAIILFVSVLIWRSPNHQVWCYTWALSPGSFLALILFVPFLISASASHETPQFGFSIYHWYCRANFLHSVSKKTKHKQNKQIKPCTLSQAVLTYSLKFMACQVENTEAL